MDEQKQADIVDKMTRAAGKFSGSGFPEWDEQAMDCFPLRGQRILAIIQGKSCPEPKFQARAARRGRSRSRERRKAVAETRATAAQNTASQKAVAADEKAQTALALSLIHI